MYIWERDRCFETDLRTCQPLLQVTVISYNSNMSRTVELILLQRKSEVINTFNTWEPQLGPYPIIIDRTKSNPLGYFGGFTSVFGI